MSRYCGAYPPKPEPRSANCLKPLSHGGTHRNMRGFEWQPCTEGCPPEPAGCPHIGYPNDDRDCGCPDDMAHDLWWRNLCADCRGRLCGLS